MTKRFKDADAIWNGGASNRLAVANALVNAIIECRAEDNYDCHDPAVQMIADHLCFLIGLPQPSLSQFQDGWWEAIEKAVAEKVVAQ